MKNKNNTYTLQSVDNTIQLVELLNEYGPMGITDLSKKMSLGKSTVHRILSTLKKRNYIIQNSENEKYMLSLKWAAVGASVLNRQGIIQIVRPYLKKLSEKYNETTYLSVLNGYQMYFIDKVLSTNAIIMDMQVGSNINAHCSASGKVLLSGEYTNDMSDYVQNVSFIKFTNNTLTNIEKLKKELENIRQNGYAIDNEEYEIGLTCYAAPIKNNLGEVIAAISISGPTERMNKNRDELINAVKNTAIEISYLLGWSN
jgi:DNA-binding IclR family transcriptional regulator